MEPLDRTGSLGKSNSKKEKPLNDGFIAGWSLEKNKHNMIGLDVKKYIFKWYSTAIDTPVPCGWAKLVKYNL